MGRIYFTSKQEADGLPKISVDILKRAAFFGHYDRGDFHSNGSVIDVETLLPGINQDYGINHAIRIRYEKLSDNNDSQKAICEVKLTTTPCKFGRFRYWFICHSYNCGKRVGVLYLSNGRFACRHCHNLSYQSRNENKRFAMIFRLDILDRKLYRLETSIKRRYYAGKPTRLQRKIDRLSLLLDTSSGVISF